MMKVKMISEEELIFALAELKGQPKEMVKCLFKYFPTEKEYTLKGYVRLLEDILMVDTKMIDSKFERTKKSF